MPEFPPAFESERTLLAILLLAGHVLADFVFQTRWMVHNKPHSKRALAAHALEVGVVQAALVLWFAWHPLALAWVALIAVTHFAIDAAKLWLDARLPRWGMSWFWLDQAVHLAVLTLAWSFWPASEPPVQPSDYPLVGRVAVIAIVYAFNVNGASALVSLLLDGLRNHRPDPEGTSGAGRLIGILERVMIVTLVWMNQWGAVGLVLTAKSVARFKKLEQQTFAEIYLVGTMSSVLAAMASGLILQRLL